MPEKTIADAMLEGERFYVNCGHPMCGHSHKIDLKALGARLGLDHGAMHNDLVKVFRCERCNAAGRDRCSSPVFRIMSESMRAEMPVDEIRARKSAHVAPGVAPDGFAGFLQGSGPG
ncbi:hypothetical protein [Mesorhizobium australicum]|uniref:hypothetical protein n=1 Tax=Mesorhizobium australicum TaxID=536018 RepID=UPI003337A174